MPGFPAELPECVDVTDFVVLVDSEGNLFCVIDVSVGSAPQ
jgi:hypothetical protein